MRTLLTTGLLAACLGFGDARAGINAAAVFGARPSISALAISPDGRSLAYVAPDPGRGGVLYVAGTEAGSQPLALLRAQPPESLDRCEWIDDGRLLCQLTGLDKVDGEPRPYHRRLALDADGGNLRKLGSGAAGVVFGIDIGDIVDLHGGAPGTVLVESPVVTDGQFALGVNRLDTRTGESMTVEPEHIRGEFYLGDGLGHVALLAVRRMRTGGYDRAGEQYLFRRAPGAKLELFCEWDPETRTGFLPLVVDGKHGRVYGLQSLHGRLAVYARPLDGRDEAELVYADDAVDVGNLVTLGSTNEVVGVTMARDYPETVYLDAGLRGVIAAIGRALPAYRDIRVTGASADANRLLIFAGSDDDPGVYFLFDRRMHQLQTLYVARAGLEGVKLGRMSPVRYQAADGTTIPAYLTLPPGVSEPKGLPAIVMPHGGPAARDEWGFDWLAQFYAHQGYAVLQPNFRGSAGFGEAWHLKNGFRSWRTSIGDVVDGARWMTDTGVADRSRLAIVGWSYGGYAALQAAVVAPELFRAVVAIAPVTDLPKFKASFRDRTEFIMLGAMLGSGDDLKDGSPARQAKRLRAPVLLVHGRADGNVPFEQTEIMDRALKAAGLAHEVVAFDGLGHSLDDTEARATLLERSDAFVRRAFEH